jgi:two-component system response regulator FixJ
MASNELMSTSNCVAIVDDDPGALAALRFMLEVEGYRTRTFTSGADFLETVSVGLPDCLVIDQNMPSMTGIEVVERMRAAAFDIPIIMITATPTDQLAERASAVGVESVIEKPLFGSGLVNAIAQSLSRRRDG